MTRTVESNTRCFVLTTSVLLLCMASVSLLSNCHAFVLQRDCCHRWHPLGGTTTSIVRSQTPSSPSLSWLSSSTHAVGGPTSTQLRYETGKNNNDYKLTSDESDEDFQRRMAVVRSLQMSFYTTTTATEDGTPNNNNESVGRRGQPSTTSTTTTTTSRLDATTGMIHRLPLWRAPWWEVPGRSNVLNVVDPIYTNMFESILYKSPPWCFGHLFLEGGSKNLRSNDPKYQLTGWANITKTMDGTSSFSSSSAVIGSLMHIKDYRRMADGRLLLLVHAMERFVVTDVQQHLPYSIVDAQILPDAEEVDPHLDFYDGSILEKDLQSARAMAVQESVRYHAYEYDQFHCLQIPVGPTVTIYDISHAAIAKVLPYCPFSKTLEPPSATDVGSMTSRLLSRKPALDNVEEESGDRNVLPQSQSSSSSASSLSSIEYNLLRRQILQVPPADPDYIYYRQPTMTTDELEYQLWLAVNHFLVVTKKPVSPILLSLLPPKSRDIPGYWPDTFCLDRIATSIGETELDHDYVPISPDYPSHRRQRRFSFSAAYLLERDTESAQALRSTLLSIPSTKIRLRVVLEKFHQWQTEQEWGEFA